MYLVYIVSVKLSIFLWEISGMGDYTSPMIDTTPNQTYNWVDTKVGQILQGINTYLIITSKSEVEAIIVFKIR